MSLQMYKHISTNKSGQDYNNIFVNILGINISGNRYGFGPPSIPSPHGTKTTNTITLNLARYCSIDIMDTCQRLALTKKPSCISK